MTFKRRALGALTRAELLEIGRGLELEVSTGMRLDELIDAVAGSKRATLERILPTLSRDTLKSICFAVGEPAEGREKQVIIDRILAASGGDERPPAKGKVGQPGRAGKGDKANRGDQGDQVEKEGVEAATPKAWRGL